MVSSLRERRRLCITIVFATALLFLPLTTTTTITPNNNALAQSQPDPAERQRRANEGLRHAYELQVRAYERCVWSVNLANSLPRSTGVSMSACGQPPQPPQPIEPLDCNELQSCAPQPCDPNFASCPRQPPLTPEEACQRFGCINPVPPGTPTPAELRDRIRRYLEDGDSIRRNPLWGPTTELCRWGGVSDPERCGRLSNPAWDMIEGLHDPPKGPRLQPPPIPFPFGR